MPIEQYWGHCPDVEVVCGERVPTCPPLPETCVEPHFYLDPVCHATPAWFEDVEDITDPNDIPF